MQAICSVESQLNQQHTVLTARSCGSVKRMLMREEGRGGNALGFGRKCAMQIARVSTCALACRVLKRVAQEKATGGKGKSSLFTSPNPSQSKELNAGDDPNWDWSSMQPAPQWPPMTPKICCRERWLSPRDTVSSGPRNFEARCRDNSRSEELFELQTTQRRRRTSPAMRFQR